MFAKVEGRERRGWRVSDVTAAARGGRSYLALTTLVVDTLLRGVGTPHRNRL
ncbi:hypothetical protein [Streptomyces rapamycinicus]|uniref:Uncharacterized protein n=1 Tax=Streptomyces rapamycinicus TaxID=1226757 RepID=A0ABR6M3H4_9ACTN|nr:hypothetical protein [Streptomyces rapamycinicus]AGP59676.1 hypothetical protein M271_41495 [Streptomyces rapamycinicus NRRL 5491]MBB4789171.1 hypothetical protein [Streptomyces rapamycinicus]UTO67371.1 hypothetical protein LJB45_37065 [Streptomyces rapamycinicus]UTP35327.1 hypothetical protein LIV37_42200 [Streptomyces rapamycinicus NRRL 5491]